MASKKQLNKVARQGGYNYRHKAAHLERKESKSNLSKVIRPIPIFSNNS